MLNVESNAVELMEDITDLEAIQILASVVTEHYGVCIQRVSDCCGLLSTTILVTPTFRDANTCVQ